MEKLNDSRTKSAQNIVSARFWINRYYLGRCYGIHCDWLAREPQEWHGLIFSR